MTNKALLIISFLGIAILFLVLLIVFYRFGARKIYRSDDKDNMKSLQTWAMGWWTTIGFILLGLPIVNLLGVFGYAIYKDSQNVTVQITFLHVADLLMYGFKVMIWTTFLIVEFLSSLKNDLPAKEVLNGTVTTWFFGFNWAFIFVTLFYSIMSFDNKITSKVMRWLLYIGTFFIGWLILSTFVFDKTRNPLPKATVIEYVGKIIDPTINASTAPAPVTYGNTTTPLGGSNAGLLGIPIYWYIGGVVLLIVIVLLFLRSRKKSGQSAPASAGQPKAAAGGTSGAGQGETTATASTTETAASPEYERTGYAADLDAIRYDIDLFHKYKGTQYYRMDTTAYWERCQRMRAYLENKIGGEGVVNDAHLRADLMNYVTKMQNLLSLNISDREAQPLYGVDVNNGDTFNRWQSIVQGALISSSDGFFLRSSDYASVISSLGYYMVNIGNVMKGEFELWRNSKVPEMKNQVNGQNYLALQKLLATVAAWVESLQRAYKPTGYNIPTPGTPQTPQPPGWFATIHSQYPKQTNYVIMGIVGLLLLLILWFFFLRGGSKSSESANPEQVQTEQVQPAAPQLSEKEFKRQKKILNTNLDLIVDALCAGQEAPTDAKEKAMTAAAKLGATAQQLNDEVRNRRQKKCPPQTEKKE